MKLFTYTIYLLMLASLLTTVSCKKYLDIKSDSSLIIPSTLFDLRSLLDNRRYMNSYTPTFGESACDDYFITDSKFNSLQIQLRNFYEWIPYDYKYLNDWALAYNPVYYANLCLERLELVNRDQANQKEWDDIKGSALFYRSYYYLELSWLFSEAYDPQSAATDPGIVLREGSDFNIKSVRSSVDVCYEKILKDAKESLDLLPDFTDMSTRPSKWTANTLLARTYLSMRQYDSAYLYANKALELKNDLMDYNDISMADIQSSNPFVRFNTETVFFATMHFFNSLYHPLFGNALVDTALYAAYSDDDLRKQAFFAPSGSYFKFKGNYARDYEIFSGMATDELYIMRAESSVRTGNTTAALDDINLLLSKRWANGTYQPLQSTSETEVLAFILKERRKELIYRGSLRWMDIKRLNKEGANINLTRVVENKTYTLPANDKRFALPLPKDITDQGIPQNTY